jgi:hypothetical protein
MRLIAYGQRFGDDWALVEYRRRLAPWRKIHREARAGARGWCWLDTGKPADFPLLTCTASNFIWWRVRDESVLRGKQSWVYVVGDKTLHTVPPEERLSGA